MAWARRVLSRSIPVRLSTGSGTHNYYYNNITVSLVNNKLGFGLEHIHLGGGGFRLHGTGLAWLLGTGCDALCLALPHSLPAPIDRGGALDRKLADPYRQPHAYTYWICYEAFWKSLFFPSHPFYPPKKFSQLLSPPLAGDLGSFMGSFLFLSIEAPALSSERLDTIFSA